MDATLVQEYIGYSEMKNIKQNAVWEGKCF